MYVWYHFVRCDALRCIACAASRLVRSSPAPFRQMCFEGLLAESRFSAVKGRRFMIRLKCVTAGLLARVCSLDRLLVCSFARLLACSLGRLHACSLARCLYVRTDKQFLLNQVYCPWPGPAVNVQNIPPRLYVTLSMQGRCFTAGGIMASSTQRVRKNYKIGIGGNQGQCARSVTLEYVSAPCLTSAIRRAAKCLYNAGITAITLLATS